MLPRLYALLLLCYPAAFRHRFAAELTFAFESGWQDARARGPLPAIGYVITAATDTVCNGVRERRSDRWYSPRAHRDFPMTTYLTDIRFGFRLMVRHPRLSALIVPLGLVAAFIATRWLETLLFQVEAFDPLTFGAVAGLLLVVAMIACYAPARRAARLDPLAAFRAD